MRTLELNLLQHTKNWLRQQINPAGLILMYHRVANVTVDPFQLCVSPDHFAAHLSALNQHCYPMPLQQFVQAMQKRRLPKRAVALTFDDGYADNLYAAKPLLEHYQIPATVFISTDHLIRSREAWWDELEKICLQPGSRPKTLRLTIQGQTYNWDLGDGADYSQDDVQRDRDWNWYISPTDDPSNRQRLYRSLYELIHPLSETDRQPIMDQLLAWAGLEVTPRPTYRFLTPSEVTSLTQGGLIEIGAHTITHPFLTTLSLNAQRQEIEGSKQKLEDLTGQPVQVFAYPYGNYSPETATVVREAGFDYACTTKSWHVRHPTNCFELPRVGVQNWSEETFIQHVLNWF